MAVLFELDGLECLVFFFFFQGMSRRQRPLVLSLLLVPGVSLHQRCWRPPHHRLRAGSRGVGQQGPTSRGPSRAGLERIGRLAHESGKRSRVDAGRECGNG